MRRSPNEKGGHARGFRNVAAWMVGLSVHLLALRHGIASRRRANPAQITIVFSAFICITPFPLKP